MTDLTAIMARSYEIIEAGALDALPEVFTEDCELVDPAVHARGLAELRKALEEYRVAFSDLRFRWDRAVADADTVVVESTISAIHTGPLTTPDGELPPTGRRIELRACEVAQFRGERIASSHIYFDQLQFMTQLGLVPEPATS